MQAENESLLAACTAYFGEFAQCVITGKNEDRFSLMTVRDAFPKIDLGRANYVQACYVRYSFEGIQYGDSTRRDRKMVYHSLLKIVFDGPRADEEIPINAFTAHTILGQYFNMAEVANACMPLRKRDNELQQSDEVKQKAATTKQTIIDGVVADMISSFQSEYALIIRRASTGEYLNLKAGEQQSIMSEAARTAFCRTFISASQAAAQLKSEMPQSVGHGAYMLCNPYGNTDTVTASGSYLTNRVEMLETLERFASLLGSSDHQSI